VIELPAPDRPLIVEPGLGYVVARLARDLAG